MFLVTLNGKMYNASMLQSVKPALIRHDAYNARLMPPCLCSTPVSKVREIIYSPVRGFIWNNLILPQTQRTDFLVSQMLKCYDVFGRFIASQHYRSLFIPSFKNFASILSTRYTAKQNFYKYRVKTNAGKHQFLSWQSISGKTFHLLEKT